MDLASKPPQKEVPYAHAPMRRAWTLGGLGAWGPWGLGRRRAWAKPSSLLPPPSSLFPTPYSLLPTSYFLLPTDGHLLHGLEGGYSLLPTPYFLLPTPYFLLPTSYLAVALVERFEHRRAAVAACAASRSTTS